MLFFPLLENRSDRGAWIFVVGSALYLLVTGHDLAEVVRYRAGLERAPTRWDRLEAWAALSYVVGTTLFLVGSLCFLSFVGRVDAGAWCFVVGSLLFVVGATINVLQIVQASDRRILQLMNLTALTFVTGSVLFTVASVPYLFSFENLDDDRIVTAFSAGQYVVGSALFFLGGVFNYWRAYDVVRREVDARS